MTGLRETEDQPITQSEIQIAIREEDFPNRQPYVPSLERKCSRCGKKVLISLGAFPLADKLPIVCDRCLGGR